MPSIQLANVSGTVVNLHSRAQHIATLPAGFTGSLNLEGQILASANGVVSITTNVIPAVTNYTGNSISVYTTNTSGVNGTFQLAGPPQLGQLLYFEWTYNNSIRQVTLLALPDAESVAYTLTSLDPQTAAFSGFEQMTPWG